MAIYRHEEAQYLTVAAIVGETRVVNKKNDVIFIEALNKAFRWREGSSLAHDGKNVMAHAVSNIYDGDITFPALQNGEMIPVEGTVTGALFGAANVVVIKNPDLIPEGLFITTFPYVTANDTVKFAIENQTGDPTAALTLNLQVLEF
jgi:hypothetical protein